jgi:hypothetical protein
MGDNQGMEARLRSRWSTMSPAHRARAAAVMLFHGGMTVFALVKLSQRPAERVPGRKWMWAVVIATNLAASSAFSWGRLVAPPPKPESD